MKKVITILTIGFLALKAQSQTVSNFEEVTLPANDYYNGDDFSGGFTSGNAFYPNYYDTTWGAAYGYWATGWAYSNIGDTVTQASSYTQMYSAKELSGFLSLNFAVGTQASVINLNGIAIGKQVNGFYITNSTYAYNSMKLGDAFAKKFGGVSGNDPDFFKLAVYGYSAGTISTDSVEFYLADYRFADNSQDYLIKNWSWVSLTALGNVDSLVFYLRSSDVGSFGINTPLYYCIDKFETADSPSNIAKIDSEIIIQVFPNPATDYISVIGAIVNEKCLIINSLGSIVMQMNLNNSQIIDISNLASGKYYLKIKSKLIPIIKK